MKYILLLALILSACQPSSKDVESKKCKRYGFNPGSEEYLKCKDELEYTPTPPL